jgi:hypothetical protein
MTTFGCRLHHTGTAERQAQHLRDESYPRLAIPVGGTKTEGHPAAAPGACGRFERADLAGLVVTFPRKADGRGLT